MDMTGDYVIAAPRERVWAALNDPELLAKAIPGCEELTPIGTTGFEATATQKIGPVKARFKGKVTLEDINPPTSYTLRGEGSGGAAGFAKGEAKVRLEEVSEGTRLIYEVKANIGGKLAQIGQRLIDQAAKKIADDFFANFGAAVTAEAAPPEVEEVAAAVPPAVASASVPVQSSGAPPLRPWLVGAAIVLALLALVAASTMF